jgi:CheY-like chemotaxis protein
MAPWLGVPSHFSSCPFLAAILVDADEAIKVLETRNDIRTIFTDIDLPGSMDGLKLAAAVRDRWPPVHIIVTTGMRAPHRDEMPANSMFIAKPYRSAEVLEAVRSFENALP